MIMLTYTVPQYTRIMKSKIEKKLREWFKYLVGRYRWLTIRFNYSEDKGIFLVSYSPTDKISECEPFIKESAEFEDLMNARFGDNSPLFCDDEKYFKLSPDAEVVTFETIKMEETLTPEYLCKKINELSTYGAKLEELKENKNEYVICLDFLEESKGYTSLTLDFNDQGGGVQLMRFYMVNSEICLPTILIEFKAGDDVEKFSLQVVGEIRKFLARDFGFRKSDRSSFKYWFAHWSAFQMTSLNHKVWRWKYLLHDIEKPWLKLFCKYPTVKEFHRTHADHHLDYGKLHGWCKMDWTAAVIDWECSRFTKMDAQLNARETLELQMKKDKWSDSDKVLIKHNIEMVLNKLGL